MVSAIPSKSQGLVINIVNPYITGDGAQPGTVNTLLPPATQNLFPAYPANYNNSSFNVPAPNPAPQLPQGNAATPQAQQQALQNLYNDAMTAKNLADQVRRNYEATANQLENQANPQAAPQPAPLNQSINVVPANVQPTPVTPQINTQNLPPALPPLPPNPMDPMALPTGQPPAALQQPGLGQPPAAPNQPLQQMPQQQVPGLPPAPPQAPGVNLNEIFQKIALSPSLRDKFDAINQVVFLSSQPDPRTGQPYTFPAELFDQLEALARPENRTQLSQQQQANDEIDAVRSAAVWALGTLDMTQNGKVPTANLPGLNLFRAILEDKGESPRLKQAVLEALQILGRPASEAPVNNLLKLANRNGQPAAVRQLADAIRKGIPANPGMIGPGPQQNPALLPPGGQQPPAELMAALAGAQNPGNTPFAAPMPNGSFQPAG